MESLCSIHTCSKGGAAVSCPVSQAPDMDSLIYPQKNSPGRKPSFPGISTRTQSQQTQQEAQHKEHVFHGKAGFSVLPYLLPPLPFNPSPRYLLFLPSYHHLCTLNKIRENNVRKSHQKHRILILDWFPNPIHLATTKSNCFGTMQRTVHG